MRRNRSPVGEALRGCQADDGSAHPQHYPSGSAQMVAIWRFWTLPRAWSSNGVHATARPIHRTRVIPFMVASAVATCRGDRGGHPDRDTHRQGCLRDRLERPSDREMP